MSTDRTSLAESPTMRAALDEAFADTEAIADVVRAAGLGNVAVTDGGCWRWQGHINRKGYGQVGRCDAAHRLAYAAVYGPLPAGQPLDHTCHNADASCTGGPSCLHRRCINPMHLEPVTNKENLYRGRGFIPEKAAQTACVAGHEFTPENTRTRKNGTRLCKECARRRCRETYRRRRSGA